ncbi:hypothetical protein DFH06DRAFT_1204843 [Mycena polygramma]|nr:hypothetical protein DFH06DRAFT_1204843 [Mycena polygramma]
MKKPSRLSALPTELIHEISGCMGLQDLLALCRTSRQIHTICLKWIYRDLTLDSPVQVLQCCRTVVSRTESAAAVRKLKINPRFELKCPLKSFCSTFESAIRLMKNLELLDVANNAMLSQIFCHISFPRLLTCTIPHSLHLFQFLGMNPMITSLTVIPSLIGRSKSGTAALKRIHMPRLENFQGPGSVACSVLPGSRTSRLIIYWEPLADFSRVLAAVEASKVEVIELSNLVYVWDPSLLAAIAKYTPRIEMLHIQYIKNHQGREDIFSAFENTLHSLPRLGQLRIMEGDGPGLDSLDHIDEALESEFEVVRKWGEMFPNVISTTLMTDTPWRPLRHPIFSQDVWYPGLSLRALKWWITKVLMSPELPDEYRTLTDCLGGDGMDRLKEAVRRDGVVPVFDILSLQDGEIVISFPGGT